MGEIISTILGSFIKRGKASKIGAHTILILVFILLWALNHYSIISRIDTYFTTGNMMKIAETKSLYKNDAKAMKVLDDMLENELEHKTIVDEYMEIFSMIPNPSNGIPKIYNTISTVGMLLIFIPLFFVLILLEYLKGKTPLVICSLVFLTILIVILSVVWISQYITGQIPSLCGNRINYVINVLFQMIILYSFVKWFKISAERAKAAT